ncbi:MAG: FecR family protein [Candidatus Eremiobacteraeota bacterium]|nr:FecR family protein [Candidatus Eremiobacteraeota bacterium]
MLVSFAKRAPIIVLLAALLAPPAAVATTDKQLQRQRGAVSYKDTAGNSHSVSASISLSDDATAVTGRASAALLSLPDSSEVVLGETTSIKVGKFNDAVSGPGSTIAVDHGALKFAIRHPSGAKANYTFTTPTSQIAVRGTEGYLIVGEKGTQIVCTACEPGDVIVTVGGVVTSIVTGQVFTILGPSAASASTAVSTSSVLNSPAVNQFSNGANPLGGTGPSADVTGSASGSTAAGGAQRALARVRPVPGSRVGGSLRLGVSLQRPS